MKPIYKITALFIFSAAAFSAYGQPKRTIQENFLFKSEILRESVRYNVYLPANYSETKTYPVIYYLHWFDGDNNTSRDFINRIDQLISEEKFPEVVIVAPDAKRTWYIDDWAGKYKYSTMFIKEFVPFVKKQYSIAKTPADTVITGTSMGGFGALRFSMLYPDEFGVCVSFMAGISTKEQIVRDNDDDYVKYHQNLYGENLKGAKRVNKHFVAVNPLYIAENAKPDDLKRVKWYLQSCDDDYHLLGNSELSFVFHKKQIKYEFRVTDGSHDGECVKNSLDDALSFIKNSIKTK